jgi:hypothetical protein
MAEESNSPHGGQEAKGEKGVESPNILFKTITHNNPTASNLALPPKISTTSMVSLAEDQALI